MPLFNLFNCTFSSCKDEPEVILYSNADRRLDGPYRHSTRNGGRSDRGSVHDGDRFYSTATFPVESRKSQMEAAAPASTVAASATPAPASTVAAPATPAPAASCDDISNTITKMRDLHASAQYVPAGKLADKIAAAIAALSPQEKQQQAGAVAEWRSAGVQHIASQSRRRRAAVEDALRTGFDGAEEEGWVLAKESGAMKTYYRRDDTTGLLHLKVDGVVEADMLDCVAVWKEAGLYRKWLPLMSSSDEVHKFSGTEVVVQSYCGVLGLGREMLLHGWGDCSHLAEDKSFMILGGSVPEGAESFEGAPMPAASGWRPRADMKALQLLVQHKGRSADGRTDLVRNCMVICVDVKMALPDALLQTLLKQCVGLLLSAFERQAQKMGADPACRHAKHVRADPWYSEWLFPFLQEKNVVPGLKFPSWYSGEKQMQGGPVANRG